MATAMLALGASAVAVSSASAALPVECAQSGRTVTCGYGSIGAEQTFTVPTGVSAVHAALIGGRGFSAGAAQAKVVADLAVTPGQTLYVEVGGQGGAPTLSGDTSLGGIGGWNGGGHGGSWPGSGVVPIASLGGGGGGGASDIRTSPWSEMADYYTSTISRLVVAGGTGGFGGVDGTAGGNAGDPNGHAGLGANGGAGGTQTDPGSGGGGGSEAIFSLGANGGFFGRKGGGGGGGYYGGGGGGGALTGPPGSFGGGGGGSSYGPAGTTFALLDGFSPVPAEVTISYTAPDTVAPTVSVAAPLDGATYAQNAAVLAAYSCADGSDGSGVASCVGDVPVGQSIDTSTTGLHAFTVMTADVDGNSATKTVRYTVPVAAAAPPPVTIPGPSPTVPDILTTADSTSPTPGPVAGDAPPNGAGPNLPVPLRAELAIAVQHRAAAIRPGQSETVTVAVTNRGPSTAHGVRVALAPGRGLSIVRAHGAAIRNGIAHFSGASLANGTSATYVVVLRSATTATGHIRLTATVGATTADPITSDNTKRAYIVVRPHAR